MIRHTVLFKLKPDVPKIEVEHIFQDLLSLTDHLTGIMSITGGTCFFHDHKDGQPFTHGFSIDFTDQSARDTFLNDVAADPMKTKIINASAGGMEGIIGFDFGEWN